MAVKLRLRRLGRKQHPIFALVAADSRSPRDGRFIEDLGRYEPINEPAQLSLKEDRILYWLQQGAQPSHTVRNLLSKRGVMLRLHLLRKGKEEGEIEQAVNDFLAHRESKGETIKQTAADRRAAALEAERATAAEEAKRLAKERAEREAELAKQKEEADKLAREEAEAIRAKKEAEAKAELAAAQDAEANKGDELAQEDNVPAGTEVSAAAAPTGEPSDATDATADLEEPSATEATAAEEPEASEAEAPVAETEKVDEAVAPTEEATDADVDETDSTEEKDA